MLEMIFVGIEINILNLNYMSIFTYMRGNSTSKL